MAYYTKEEIEKARQIDLLSYLKLNEPDELDYCSRNTYTTKEHDSLRISNGMWYWFSQGIGGASALDYLIKVRGYTFLEAVENILKLAPRNSINIKKELTKKEKIDRLILPKKNGNNNRVKWYLIQRGIDKDIINECIDNELIYESAYNHNVVFVGIDENKIPRYAGVRGTNHKKFMMDASGSDKTYSFRIEAIETTDTIHLFESAIDLLSYATYEKERNKEWYKDTLIALAGVYQPATKIEDSKIPVALNYYLKKNPNIKRIVIHFDNDRAGRMATKALQTILSNNYEVIDRPPKFGKDFNDFLCATKGINFNKNEIKRKEDVYEK